MCAYLKTELGAYLKNTGEFTVRYVLENRLLEGDGKISKIRKVQVLDVDECTYTGPHKEVRDGSLRHLVHFLLSLLVMRLLSMLRLRLLSLLLLMILHGSLCKRWL